VRTDGASANFVSHYQLIINGRPVRTIGSNLIPPDLLFAGCCRARFICCGAHKTPV